MNYRNVLRAWLAILASAVSIVAGTFAIGVYYKSNPLAGLRQAWFDLVGLPGLPTAPTSATAPSASKAPPARIVNGARGERQYAPGWIVQLRTSTATGQAIFPDSPFLAAYIDPGPSFEESTFVKRATLEGSRQIVLGMASSKFEARTQGEHQFGLRMEIRHPWADIGCSERLFVNDAVLIDRWDRRGTRDAQDVINIAMARATLSVDVHDVVLEFGCAWFDQMGTVPRQAIFGKVTILVARPGDLAAKPAEPNDFLYSVSTATQVIGH